MNYKYSVYFYFNVAVQVSFTFGADVVSKFLNRHDLDLICRAHQVRIDKTLLGKLDSWEIKITGKLDKWDCLWGNHYLFGEIDLN